VFENQSERVEDYNPREIPIISEEFLQFFKATQKHSLVQE
jgi:hypothetical protein